MAPLPEPTRDELDQALTGLHSHGLLSGVVTLDDALANPLAARLLRMHARLSACGIATLAPPHQRPVVQAPEPPHPALDWHAQLPSPPRKARPKPATPPTVRRRSTTSADLFDPKAAAAGDCGDDA